MTYQEVFEKLQKIYAEKSDKFMKMDNEISHTKGFGDIGDLFEYNNAKNEWQDASNAYWGFLSFVRGKNVNPNENVDSDFYSRLQIME